MSRINFEITNSNNININRIVDGDPPTNPSQRSNTKIISVSQNATPKFYQNGVLINSCLLYTSDAADDMQCVDLGGRRII